MTSRDRYLQRIYKITEAQYEKLLFWGNFRCWICGKPPTKRRLHVEHDHRTGRIRGLACWSCNTLLQRAHDDPGILRSAVKYLESYEADHILERDVIIDA